MIPAGFARRYVAWSLDAAPLLLLAVLACLPVIHAGMLQCAAALAALSDALAAWMLRALDGSLSLPGVMLQWLGDPAVRAATHALAAAVLAAVWPPVLVFTGLVPIWHAVFEASRWQASPGKRVLGLRVVDAGGGRIGLARGLLRQVAGALSWLSLNLGHLWVMVPPRHRALHDAIAKTQVLQHPHAERLPAWAKAWIVLQVIVALAAFAWLQQTMNAALQAAFDAVAL